jgi:hypothetical protein
MRTLKEFMEFYGIKKIKYGRKPGSIRDTARFQDHNGTIQTLFYAEKVDHSKPLFVATHTGMNEKGELVKPQLVGSLWVINSQWEHRGTDEAGEEE